MLQYIYIEKYKKPKKEVKVEPEKVVTKKKTNKKTKKLNLNL